MKERKSEKLVYKVFSRVDESKYRELQNMLKQSRCRTLSELLRSILYHEKITIVTHDDTLDRVMEQLSGIRKELQAIGININQITHRFHMEDLPEGKLQLAIEVLKCYRETDLKVSQLLTMIAKISTLWLPES